MDFRVLLWKRVWKITFSGLKSGQNLENRAAHPHQEFPGVPPGKQAYQPRGTVSTLRMRKTLSLR